LASPNITLYTLGGAFGKRNVSPFCLKLEMLLTALQVPFEMAVQPDPRKAPKGKLPYAVIDGETIADSELIMNKLDEMTQGRVFGSVEAAARAKGFALTRLAEEHLYWIMVASRWLDDDWFPNVVEGFFHIAPGIVRPLIANMARRQVRRTYDLQGLGRHSHAEQVAFARRDLQTLQDAVTSEGFLCGAAPNVFDFAVASIMTGVYDNRPKTWLTPIAEEYAALHAYTVRVQEHVGVYAREQR